jgi:hypothetical protein
MKYTRIEMMNLLNDMLDIDNVIQMTKNRNEINFCAKQNYLQYCSVINYCHLEKKSDLLKECP